MGLTAHSLSVSFVPQRTESTWRVLAGVTCHAVEGRNAKGGVRNGFLGRAFSMGTEFIAESFKVQLFKGAN